MNDTALRVWLEELTLQQMVALRVQRCADDMYSEVVGETREQHVAALLAVSGVSTPFPA